jgi:hypothetical protein
MGIARLDYDFGVVVSAAFFGTVVSAVFFGVVVSAVFLPATVVSAEAFGFGASAHFKLLPVFLQTNADPFVVLALPPTFVHLVPTFAVAVLALPGAAKATSARGAIAKSASSFFMPITVSRSAIRQSYLRLQHVQVLTATSGQPQQEQPQQGQPKKAVKGKLRSIRRAQQRSAEQAVKLTYVPFRKLLLTSRLVAS